MTRIYIYIYIYVLQIIFSNILAVVLALSFFVGQAPKSGRQMRNCC